MVKKLSIVLGILAFSGWVVIFVGVAIGIVLYGIELLSDVSSKKVSSEAEESFDASVEWKSRTQPGRECFKHELDPSVEFDPSVNDATELEWLWEACYQQEIFDLEWLYCMYGDKDAKIPVPNRNRMMNYYPCDFSDQYIRNFGPPDEPEE